MALETQDGYLSGQLLIAMPQMTDPRFEHSVVYMCAHNADGAMGLVVNKLVDAMSFTELLRQMELEIESDNLDDRIQVHFGGPVESARGFVLHTTDYVSEATMRVDDTFSMTATIDVLRSIARGSGPSQAIFTLGYAGWAPGQLDTEIQSNGWLNVAADQDLVFGREHDIKWTQAVAKVGVDPSFLSSEAGDA
ncbi:MAG: YqgE/AlgH family protein [Alphaproteobacteria bacterium]